MINEELCAASCADKAAIRHPISLCARHAIEVSSAVLSGLRGSLNDSSRGDDILIDNARQYSRPETPGSHRETVYFLRNGNRVKIGYTTNLSARVISLSLRLSDVVLVLAGSQTLESALHRRFASFRVGDTEWFEWGQRIASFVALKSATPIAASYSTRPAAPTSSDLPTAGTPDASRTIKIVLDLMGNERGVLLTRVARSLNDDDSNREWTTRAVRRLLKHVGIPVREGVRTSHGNGPGVHRADVPKLDDGLT